MVDAEISPKPTEVLNWTVDFCCFEFHYYAFLRHSPQRRGGREKSMEVDEVREVNEEESKEKS